MKIYVGVTDSNWYYFLKELKCDEVNFWRPSGKTNFKAIDPNDIFLFKLRSPYNYIVGGGFFVRYSILPLFLAWDAFGPKNGAYSLEELNKSIKRYRSNSNIPDYNYNIGCIILNKPFFFEESDWIPVPRDWAPNIVQGKTYDTDTEIGHQLYQQVTERLQMISGEHRATTGEEPSHFRIYGKEQIIRPRLGQGAFRIVVTEAYSRKCSITGERTLPVLDAAHIMPFSQKGPSITQNGILLRTDIHALFDKGYLTITDDLKVEVSRRLKEDYGNGKIYYPYHGKSLANLPLNKSDMPAKEFLQWHNQNIYLG
ncbi:MAG: HNH endonuclease, partial [Caldicoprobacterales bacterium]